MDHDINNDMFALEALEVDTDMFAMVIPMIIDDTFLGVDQTYLDLLQMMNPYFVDLLNLEAFPPWALSVSMDQEVPSLEVSLSRVSTTQRSSYNPSHIKSVN